MAGNDFVQNPRGSNLGRRPTMVNRTPGDQRPADRGLNMADAAPGALTAAEEASPGKAADDVGVGTIGNGAKPFRLNGG
jgi:hypothetical protein